MTRERGYLSAGLALLAGFCLRLYFIRAHAHVAGDSLVYGDLATNMLRHHLYGFTEGTAVRSTLIRLPGYPVFLAACFAVFGVAKYTAVLYAQLVMDLTSCCLLGLLARRLMGVGAGLLALWLAALCPFTANYVAAPLTETLTVFCVTLSYFALERWRENLRQGTAWSRWLWPLGVALSFAVLLRPDRALLAAAVVGAMGWTVSQTSAPMRRKLAVPVAAVCLIITLPLAGWAARNWRVFHVVQPLAPRYANDPGETVNYGFQRWYRTWAIDFKSTVDVYWTFDGAPLAISDLPDRAFDSSAQRARTEQIYALYNIENVPSPPIDASFAAIAAERVHSHPVRYYVALPVLKLADMWLRPRTEMLPLPLDWWRFGPHAAGSLKAITLALLNLLYLVLAAMGLWRWRRKGWSSRRALGYSMVAFVLLRSALLLTIDNSEPRYTIDCFPVVILFAAFALSLNQKVDRT